ncbi:MAG: T9SS type A sorting domain-containing protein [Bacteroidales bacterium]|nr:T9SS type A sorting domain-containing protein [Bacteroidales bacterium]MCF8390633.1 T9SS type A sorting domain-containing protein [Bacteroidales bacterium]
MIRLIYIISLLLTPFLLKAQSPNGNYNPYVNNGIISPSPIAPVQVNGKGFISFNIGNSGSDALVVTADQHITLTITLSFGEPDNTNPVLAVSGTSSSLFSWSYNSINATYTGIQTATIEPGSSGTIIIAYKVTRNSASPGLNGFNVNISPAAYQTQSNTQDDDAVNSYTYTEIRDYGDAPLSYGSAYHVLDFLNYLGSVYDGETVSLTSVTADGDDLNNLDDEDGVVFPALIQQGEAVNVSVTVVGLGRLNAWIDWNADGDFSDANEQIASNLVRFDGTANILVNVPEGAATSIPTFARFRFSPNNLSSSSGLAIGGEVEDYQISISPSPQAPTIPAGLKVDSFTENAVYLSWEASTDNVGVTSYKIYRGGTVLGSSTSLSYTDNTVLDGNSYTYAVSALNAAGFESGQSNSVTVNIADATPPSIPSGLKVTSVTNSTISLNWNSSIDNIGVTGYTVYRNGELLGTTVAPNYNDNTVSEGNTYTYTVSSFDDAGNTSEQSTGVTASINDITAPDVPDGLMLTSASVNAVSLSWNASTDNVGVAGYNIFRNGVLLDTETGLSYTDNTVSPGNSYNYAVSAFDEAGNESTRSSEVTTNTNDTEAPTVPSGLKLMSVSDNSVSLSWDASTDNVMVTGYRIYRGGVFLNTTSELSFIDNTVEPENAYSYAVLAFDEAGNASQLSNQITANTVDTTPPSTPADLMAQSASGSCIKLIWGESNDNVGVTGYRVYRAGDLLSTVNTPSYSDKTVTVGNTYSYSVSAIDGAGNESLMSDTLIVSITSVEHLIFSELSVYPNPSDGKFVIEINENSGQFTLEIVSANGVVSAQSVIEMEEKFMPLSFEYLEAGIYYIRIFNSERIYYAKLVFVK